MPFYVKKTGAAFAFYRHSYQSASDKQHQGPSGNVFNKNTHFKKKTVSFERDKIGIETFFSAKLSHILALQSTEWFDSLIQESG